MALTKLRPHPMARDRQEMFVPAFRRYSCGCRAAGDVSPRRILKAYAKFEQAKPAAGRVERALYRVIAQHRADELDALFYGGR